MNWAGFIDTFDELYTFVDNEPKLAAFRASVRDLSEKARSVAAGQKRMSVMPRNPVELFSRAKVGPASACHNG